MFKRGVDWMRLGPRLVRVREAFHWFLDRRWFVIELFSSTEFCAPFGIAVNVLVLPPSYELVGDIDSDEFVSIEVPSDSYAVNPPLSVEKKPRASSR